MAERRHPHMVLSMLSLTPGTLWGSTPYVIAGVVGLALGGFWPIWFRPKGNLELRAPYSRMPDESMDVEVHLRPHEDIQAREVRVELVGKEATYSASSTDGSSTWSRSLEQFTSVRRVLKGEGRLHKGIEQEWRTSFQLPTNARPTCKGKIVDVNWTIQAVVDVPWRRDLVRDSSLTVPAVLPKGLADASERASTKNQKATSGECALDLEIPTYASEGDRIMGSLRVSARRPFGVRGIRIELVCSEKAGARKEETIDARQELDSSTSFDAGEVRSYTFSLGLPSDGKPTVSSPKSSLGWHVRAVLDLRLRRDFRIEGEVPVASIYPSSIRSD